MRFMLATLTALAFAHIQPVSAQDAPNLIVEISDAELQQVEARNRDYLARNAYWSKDYRVVRIDHKILRSTETVAIKLSDDLVLHAKTAMLEIGQNGVDFSWTGELEELGVPLQLLNSAGVPEDFVQVIVDRFNFVKVSVTQVGFFPSESRVVQPFHPDFEASSKSSIVGDPYVSIHATIDLYLDPPDPNSIETFRIRPIPRETDYYLIAQIDPEKRFSVDESGNAPNEEMQRRKEAYEEFLTTIGDNNGPSDVPRRERN